MNKDTIFSKGMNYDLPEETPQEGFYKLLQNGSIDAGESSMGSVVNDKGNLKLIVEWPSDAEKGVKLDNPNNPYDTFDIIGTISVGKDIVIFYHDASSQDSGIIDVLKFKEFNSDNRPVYVRIQLINDVELKFSLNKKVFGLGTFISEDNIKVYFSEKSLAGDDLNDIRFLNIAPDIVDGEVQNPLLQGSYTKFIGFDISNLEMVGKFDISYPIFLGYGNGSLRNGSVQYAYRYYNRNGNKTLWSDLSPMIPLFPTKYDDIRTLKGGTSVGSVDDINSGKSIKISILGTDNYDYVEIVRLWYPNYNAHPEAIICGRTKIGSSSLKFIDSIYESDLGVVEADDLLNLRSKFNAKALEYKDKRLYAANIKENYFNVDFDARVCRFNSSGVSNLYNDSGSLDYSINGSLTDWKTTVSGIPEDADFINRTNILSYDETHDPEIYKSDGATVGAEGPNVEIDFVPVSLDIYNEAVQLTSYSINDGNLKEVLGIRKFFQPDEIYRFGVVFFDEFGRSTPVKYIGDIRMPEREDNYVAYRPKFTINHVGTSVEGMSCKIVYVKREEYDMTHITEGLMMPPLTHPTEGYKYPEDSMFNGEVNDSSYNSTFGFMYSPDASYGNNFSFENSYVRHLGTLRDGNSPYVSDFMVMRYLYKPGPDGTGEYNLYTKYNFKQFYKSLDTLSNRQNTVTEGGVIPFKGSAFSSNFGTISSSFYKDLTMNSVDYEIHSDNATCFYVGGLPSVYGVAGEYGLGICSIRKDIDQYGGRSYEERVNNSYVAATGVWNLSDINYSTSTRGDVYLTTFELQRLNYPKDFDFEDNNKVKKAETIVFPVFSRVNWNLREDDYFSSVYGSATKSEFQLTEEGTTLTESLIGKSVYEGVDLSNMTVISTQIQSYQVSWSSLYLYNSAYSAEEFLLRYSPEDTTKYNNSDLIFNINYSEKRTEANDYDDWLVFKPLNYDQADSDGGEIVDLVSKHDRLYVFQDNAISLARVNERATVPTESGESLLIAGSGLALDGFQYITKDVGLQGISEVIESPSSMYWVDLNNKKFYRLSDSISSLSDIKGFSTWFKKTLDEHITFEGYYDRRNTSILLTIKDVSDTVLFDDSNFFVSSVSGSDIVLDGNVSNLLMGEGHLYTLHDEDRTVSGIYRLNSINSGYLSMTHVSGNVFSAGSYIDLQDYMNLKDSYTLEFNEKLDIFTSIKSFIPVLYVKGIKGLYTVGDDNFIYEHNVGNRGTFYGVTYPTIIDFVFSAGDNAVYDSINVFNRIYKDDGRDVEGYLDYEGVENESITGIQVLSNVKGSDFVPLYIKDGEQDPEIVNNQVTGNYDPDIYSESIRNLRDTSSICIAPYPAYLYNIRRQGNKFVTNIPKIRTLRQDENLRDINYDTAGNYVRIRLFYDNLSNNLMKLNRVRINFNPKLT